MYKLKMNPVEPVTMSVPSTVRRMMVTSSVDMSMVSVIPAGMTTEQIPNGTEPRGHIVVSKNEPD